MESKKPIKHILYETVQIIATAALIAFILNTFLIANCRVPSGSMEPTIMTGDRIIGSRLAYGFSDPQRGEIIIFDYPDDESVQYVKRIIGLPGEEIRISGGNVYIDGSSDPLDEPYIMEPMAAAPDAVYVVPEDCYFVLGDNRNHSNDSRFWENTYVRSDQIIAKAWIRYFPGLALLIQTSPENAA